MSEKTQIDIDEFKRYYLEEKHTIQECADYFGCSVAPVRKMIKANGWERKIWSKEAKARFKKNRQGKVSPRKIVIPKSELVQFYITENHSVDECAKHFNCGRHIVLKRLAEYGLRKPDLLRVNKIRKTSLEKYGVNYTSSYRPFRQKAEQTWLKKYGVDNPAKASAIRGKIRATNLERYGVPVTSQNPQVRAKMKQTMLSRYGRENITQAHIPQESIEIASDREKMKKFILSQEDRTTYALAAKLGYTHLHINDIIHNLQLDEYVTWGGSKSHYEKEIQAWLKGLGYRFYHTKAIIKPYELDLYNKEHKIAIEFNGDYWHGLKGLEDKNYHLRKSLLCEEKGIRLIHIWEHEWNNPIQQAVLKNIILSALKDPSLKSVFARKCSIEVRTSKAMREFFDQNNIQGFRGGKFALCLVYDGEVVMSYIMGRCHFAKGKYDWEVIRGATKLGYYVIGGASRLWKYFVKNYNPKNCVYYVDFNQFNGHSVEKLGFKYLRTEVSFRDYWVREQKVTNRNPSRHKEIKALMEQGLVLPLYNAGVKTYVWGEPNEIKK